MGFICEGDVEKALIESPNFQNLLQRFEIECVKPIINAEGNGNLLPHNIQRHRDNLKDNNAEIVLIITDLDNSTSITSVKNRISPLVDEILIVSVKQVEAWFLADSITMSIICEPEYFFEFPENEVNPFETIRRELLRITGRGYGRYAKLKFADNFIRNGFSIENAANHPNCPSAKYFINKLQSLSRTHS
ncbi:hypothetical protein [Emticicia sp. TH156]|uniref:hypothetical protein n=1 Tax=Emticicia sp. TH156 TaxID=2067454 RepID=UPI000CC7FD08|nr:hypothetical protein [Emticicia sp. TH156]PLK45096.1 hypothetical protein C0V77_07620 [Emticicia sp. TH156]